jgi:hypothetical protein
MEYPIEYADVRDEALPQRDSSILRVKKYTFFLGKFGPFIERIPLDQDQTTELQRRVSALKTHLTLIHT